MKKKSLKIVLTGLLKANNIGFFKIFHLLQNYKPNLIWGFDALNVNYTLKLNNLSDYLSMGYT